MRLETKYRHWLAGRSDPKVSQPVYLTTAFVEFLPRAVVTRVRRRLGRPARTPASAKAHYDQVRSRIVIDGFDRYVYGDPEEQGVVLQDGRIVYGHLAEVRRREREHVVDAVAAACGDQQDPVVIEAGSGAGGNLLLLKQRHPHITAIGLELSPESVRVAREAAKRFGLDVTFHQADLTEPLADQVPAADVVYSCHALEQIPDLFPRVVETMFSLSKDKVLFFEPVGEAYGRGPRGLAGRLRLAAVDYLNGLLHHLRERDTEIEHVARLGIGLTPLNETVEIHCRAGTRRT